MTFYNSENGISQGNNYAYRKSVKMGLAENLQAILKSRGLQANDLAGMSGVPASRISEIVTGKTLNPQLKTLKKLADALGASVSDLTGEAHREHRHTQTISIKEIPVLGRISAGFPNLAVQEVVEYIAIPGTPENSFALVVRGASMEPSFRDGDYVIFIENGDYRSNDVLIVLDEWGEAMVKRLKEKDGKRYLVSDNPAYPVVVPNEHYRIIGRVVKVWRDIKF